MSEAARVSDAVLVVRLGAMGDILHALPAATSLKLSYPHRKLTWIVDYAWAPLLQANPYVDRVILVRGNNPRAWLAARRELQEWQYGVAVDFQGLIKSAAIAWLANPRRLFGFRRTETREALSSIFYTDCASSPAAHQVERNLDLAKAAGATVLTTESFLPSGKPEGDLPVAPFILASPLAGWTSKQWPVEFFDELGAILQREAGMPLVLNTSPRQVQLIGGVRHAQLHASGIPGLIDATRRATAVVGVDSGPMHLAAALRRPGVAIFGPTDPARNGPYGNTLHVLREAGAPTSYQREGVIAASMRRISPQQVWDALQPVLLKADRVS